MGIVLHCNKNSLNPVKFIILLPAETTVLFLLREEWLRTENSKKEREIRVGKIVMWLGRLLGVMRMVG